ncbi:hypothetical protein HWV62_15773, partial [Athelia sp. TMB]
MAPMGVAMTPAKSTPLSPAETLVDGYFPFTASPDSPSKAPIGATLSPARKYVLFSIFCLAQFLDAFNNSALFSAMPSLIIDLGITEGQSTWIMSAFQLTFASFLLVSGRISDVYNPKFAFIIGVGSLGVISLGAGFASDKILLIVLRAFSGI